MKVLKGIEKNKYIALVVASMYVKTGDTTYMLALKRIIDETWHRYDTKGVSDVIGFIYEELL